jgi:hypothetical protein
VGIGEFDGGLEPLGERKKSNMSPELSGSRVFPSVSCVLGTDRGKLREAFLGTLLRTGLGPNWVTSLREGLGLLGANAVGTGTPVRGGLVRDLPLAAAVLRGNFGRLKRGIDKLRGWTEKWAWDGIGLCGRRAKAAPEAWFRWLFRHPDLLPLLAAAMLVVLLEALGLLGGAEGEDAVVVTTFSI